MNLIKAIDETCVPQEGNSEEFYKGYHTAIIDVFRVLRRAQKALSPPPTQEQESQQGECSYPDCGCDGAQHCFVSNPNNGAKGLNIEKGSVSKWIHRGREDG